MSKFNAVLCRAAHEERKRNAELQKLAKKRAEELKTIVSEYVDAGPRDELDIDDTINEEATFSTADVADLLGVKIAYIQRLVHAGYVPANVTPGHVEGRVKFMFTPATVARMVERNQQGLYVGFPELSGEIDPPPGWIEPDKIPVTLKLSYVSILKLCRSGEIEAKKFRLPNKNKWHISPQGLKELIEQFGV